MAPELNYRIWCPAAGEDRPTEPNLFIPEDNAEDWGPWIDAARNHVEELELMSALVVPEDERQPIQVFTESIKPNATTLQLDVSAYYPRRMFVVARGDLIE